jgi:hypothetical protein
MRLGFEDVRMDLQKGGNALSTTWRRMGDIGYYEVDILTIPARFLAFRAVGGLG